jgi:hypothetical protein
LCENARGTDGERITANIRDQFLFEAVVLYNMGGAVAVLAGFALGNLAAVFSHFQPRVPLEWAAIGLVFCSVVGIASCVLPAIRASRLDPIEALGYEYGGGGSPQSAYGPVSYLGDLRRRRRPKRGRRREWKPGASRGGRADCARRRAAIGRRGARPALVRVWIPD